MPGSSIIPQRRARASRSKGSVDATDNRHNTDLSECYDGTVECGLYLATLPGQEESLHSHKSKRPPGLGFVHTYRGGQYIHHQIAVVGA
jgi:hypothetical protein